MKRNEKNRREEERKEEKGRSRKNRNQRIEEAGKAGIYYPIPDSLTYSALRINPTSNEFNRK